MMMMLVVCDATAREFVYAAGIRKRDERLYYYCCLTDYMTHLGLLLFYCRAMCSVWRICLSYLQECLLILELLQS